jgi:hypothetical protein
MDEKKNETDDQPNDWQGIEDALEESFQFSIPSSQFVTISR